MVLHRADARHLDGRPTGGSPSISPGNCLRRQWSAAPPKSYAERLFDFPQIGLLSPEYARLAIAKPAADRGVEINPEALDAIVLQAQCYPYFLQEWRKHVWDVAEASPISAADVEIASRQGVAALDESFFLVRFDRLTPAEKLYVRAMSQLGPGPHRSGDIADALAGG